MTNSIAISLRLLNGSPLPKNNISFSLSNMIKAQTQKYKVSASRVTTVATVFYPNHGFLEGDSVVLSGVAPFNGTYTITAVNTDSFNFTVADAGATSDTPNVLRTILFVNEYRGQNMRPNAYAITGPLTGSGGLSTLLPIGSFINGTVIYYGQATPGQALVEIKDPADGTPSIFFMEKNIYLSQYAGATLTFTDMDRALTVVTVTSANHGLKVNNWITVDSSNNALDGTYQVATVVDNNTFTYVTTTSGTVTSATGTGYLQRTEVRMYEEGAQNNTYQLNDLYSTIAAQSQSADFFAPIAAAQALSGAGAITITQYLTNWTTTGANAGTLANGTIAGQVKKIVLVVDGGDGTLTPTSMSGGTTITFNDANDYVLLQWSGSAWVVIENVGCTIA